MHSIPSSQWLARRYCCPCFTVGELRHCNLCNVAECQSCDLNPDVSKLFPLSTAYKVHEKQLQGTLQPCCSSGGLLVGCYDFLIYPPSSATLLSFLCIKRKTGAHFKKSIVKMLLFSMRCLCPVPSPQPLCFPSVELPESVHFVIFLFSRDCSSAHVETGVPWPSSTDRGQFDPVDLWILLIQDTNKWFHWWQEEQITERHMAALSLLCVRRVITF